MPGITANFDGLRDLGRNAGQAADVLERVRRRTMLRGLVLVQKEIVRKVRDPGGGFESLVAAKAGGLQGSWQPFESLDGLEGSVTSTKRIYPQVMNDGRKPGSPQPPIDPIVNWIKDKRLFERNDKGARAIHKIITGKSYRKKRPKKPTAAQRKATGARLHAGLKKRRESGLPSAPKRVKKPRRILTDAQRKEQQIRGMAFTIARKIGKDGIKGRFYVESALKDATPELDKIFGGLVDVATSTLAQP